MSSDTSTLSAAGTSLLNGIYNLFGADNVTVTSAGRTYAQNASAAGSSKTSQHLTGDAIDFQVKGMTSTQVQAAVARSGLTFGQLIDEGPTNHTHIGVGTSKELLTQKTNGSIVPTAQGALNNVVVPSVIGSTSNNPSTVLDNAMAAVTNWASGGIKKATGGAVDLSNNAGTSVAANGNAVLHPIDAATSWLADHALILIVGGVGVAIILFGAWHIVNNPAEHVVSKGIGLAKAAVLA